MWSASQPARPRRSNPAAMWTAQNFYKTSYKQQQEQATSTYTNQAQRPLWSYPKAAYTSQLGFFNTEAHGTMGKYGSNPILARHEQQKKGQFEKEREDIIDGKTRGMGDKPIVLGHDGSGPNNIYLQTVDFHKHKLATAKNGAARDFVKSKTNMVENYQVWLPGYAGYKPASILNDRGNVRPNCFDTQGETFN